MSERTEIHGASKETAPSEDKVAAPLWASTKVRRQLASLDNEGQVMSFENHREYVALVEEFVNIGTGKSSEDISARKQVWARMEDKRRELLLRPAEAKYDAVQTMHCDVSRQRDAAKAEYDAAKAEYDAVTLEKRDEAEAKFDAAEMKFDAATSVFADSEKYRRTARRKLTAVQKQNDRSAPPGPTLICIWPEVFAGHKKTKLIPPPNPLLAAPRRG